MKRPQGKIIYHASIDTPNYSFDAYGSTREEAQRALMEVWKRHCQQTGAEPTYITRRDLTTVGVELGRGYRDRQEVLP